MLSLALLSLATALLCLPDRRARQRVRRPGSTRTPHARPAFAALRFVAIPLAAVAGGLVAGMGGLCAGAFVAVLAGWYIRRRAAIRSRTRHTARLADGLRLMVAELRAGAHPASAAEGAAAESAPEVAEVFRKLAATARLGGDIGAALTSGVSRRDPGDALPLARIARAWSLAEQHGVALAELLDSVRRDLDHRADFARSTDAKLAGPRASSGLLAGLPLVGVLLGEASGSAPLAVLTQQVFGQLLLVIGVGLLGAGVVWTTRLTETVVHS